MTYVRSDECCLLCNNRRKVWEDLDESAGVGGGGLLCVPPPPRCTDIDQSVDAQEVGRGGGNYLTEEKGCCFEIGAKSYPFCWKVRDKFLVISTKCPWWMESTFRWLISVNYSEVRSLDLTKNTTSNQFLACVIGNSQMMKKYASCKSIEETWQNLCVGREGLNQRDLSSSR